MINEKNKRGSMINLQHYVNTPNLRDKLSRLIVSASPSLLSFMNQPDGIVWKSPLSEKGNYEFRDDFLEIFSMGEEQRKANQKKIRDNWPKNGPKWDGLATVKSSSGTEGALLVEAKSHISETKSSTKASDASKEKIENTFQMIRNKMDIHRKDIDWTKEHYKMANRIAYLYIMNEVLQTPSWLVLVNFVDDIIMPTSLEQWLCHYKSIFTRMGINYDTKLMERIIMVFPEAK